MMQKDCGPHSAGNNPPQSGMPSRKRRFRSLQGRGPFAAYKNLSLWKKMLLGYFTVIVLPFSAFMAALVNNYYIQAYDKFLADKQQSMQLNFSSLSQRISQIQSYSLLFQNDRAVIYYLGGYYKSVSEEIVTFLTDIRPLFAYISSFDHDIYQMTVYSLKEPLVALPTHIVYSGESAAPTEKLDIQGRWSFEKGSEGNYYLKFHIPLFTNDFYKRLGYLEIILRDSFPNQYMPSSDQGFLFFYTEGEWLCYKEGGLKPVEGDPLLAEYLQRYQETVPGNAGMPSYRAGGLLFNRMDLSGLEGSVVSITPQSTVAGIRQFGGLIIAMAVLFLILSGLYYLIISSFTRRLLIFSRYISKTDYNFLEEYREEPSRDEIGQVIHSYNGMILRIRDLIADLNIAELKKNEANYFALQAQIRPHFLYNSLETARMMAEADDNSEVADFLYNLGGFIRYSFSSVQDLVPLKKEIEIVGKYLEIYKASMGSRIITQITVECDISSIMCPPFIVQPLVENSIHHGIGRDTACLMVHVLVTRIGNTTIVIVRDNGAGIPADKLEIIQSVLQGRMDPGKIVRTRAGIGIGNTWPRIRNCFGERAMMAITSGPDSGTECRIEIVDPPAEEGAQV